MVFLRIAPQRKLTIWPTSQKLLKFHENHPESEQIPPKSSKILQNRAKSSKPEQNPPKSGKILQNRVKSSKIEGSSQNSTQNSKKWFRCVKKRLKSFKNHFSWFPRKSSSNSLFSQRKSNIFKRSRSRSTLTSVKINNFASKHLPNMQSAKFQTFYLPA